jgi:hypothetical protein
MTLAQRKAKLVAMKLKLIDTARTLDIQIQKLDDEMVAKYGHANETCDCKCGHVKNCCRCGFYGKAD